ncbi:MAG: DUF6398 domain-containing protein [Candidatus Dormibacteraeota bacterium]|nr:DUF6398 domain-containing protein [Candidatus Dormibacteraeota bacterium]
MGLSRVPRALREDVAAITALIDQVCNDHLDAEYAELCGRLLGRLARKRPSPLFGGELRVWAAAVLYTVGGINFLFDPHQNPHLRGDDLAKITGVAKSTIANKASLIRRSLRIDPFAQELCRREMLEHHPYAWLVEINGVVVDARVLPPALQEEVRRRGLVRWLQPPTATSPP